MLSHNKTLAFLAILLQAALFSQTSAMSTSSAAKPVINHLLQRSSLGSQFYALRHGQSLANVAKIISSDPKISTVEHGLSDLGKEQARMAGEAFASEYLNGASLTVSPNFLGVAIFSSDFTRARETASIFAEALTRSQIPLYNNDVILETRLRERFFGDLNSGPDTRYQDVWDIDVKDANHNYFNVESANSVLERTTKLVLELDELLQQSSQKEDSKKQSGDAGGPYWKAVLVAHGDVLQILQTGFLKHSNASMHRSLQHLETATIRELILPSE